MKNSTRRDALDHIAAWHAGLLGTLIAALLRKTGDAAPGNREVRGTGPAADGTARPGYGPRAQRFLPRIAAPTHSVKRNGYG